MVEFLPAALTDTCFDREFAIDRSPVLFCTPVGFKNLPVELCSRGCDLSSEDSITVAFLYTALADIPID
jgi:hypothetical protein